MNNFVDKAKGKTKQAWGDVTDNDSLKAEGQLDEAKGHVKDHIDDKRDKAGDRIDEMMNKANDKLEHDEDRE